MAFSDIEILKPEAWSRIRDIYIPMEEAVGGEQGARGYAVSQARIDETIAYTGRTEPFRLYDGNAESGLKLFNLWQDAALGAKSQISLPGVGNFRAQRMRTRNGWELALRVLPSVTPHLNQLRMSPVARELMMDQELLGGGLGLICSTNGQGKTTMASAVVRSRLEAFAGICNSVEDPPELPLDGFHGRGRCYQIPAESDENGMPGSGYAKALIDTLRFFPGMAGGGTILFVGEIRDPVTALQTILAAANGHFVIATVHGHSIPAALMRISTLAQATPDSMPEKQVNSLLADTLRLVQYQTLQYDGQVGGDDPNERWAEGRLNCSVLSVPRGENKITKLISEGKFTELSPSINHQRKLMMEMEDEMAKSGGERRTGVASTFRKKALEQG